MSMTEVLKQQEVITVGKEYLLTNGNVVEALVLLPNSIIVRNAGCYKKFELPVYMFLDATCLANYTEVSKEYYIELPETEELSVPVQDTSYELN
ncbi:hypothetical protein AEO54_389 [Vibrio phage vB_VorS-PVo5]|nr:hypothetical protein AEO54_389 [Vibrio phage vB_VorS-PVo5]